MKRLARWLGIVLFAAPALAGDWPMWGHDPSRNMVSPEKGLPETFDPGKPKEGKDEIDPATAKNIKWAVRIGDASYGNPTVSGGKIFIGTNNDVPRNPERKGDFGVLMCLDEATGKFLWQLTVPKLSGGDAVDTLQQRAGLCCSPAVDGDRVYVVTNRCEVVCVTTDGLAKGNVGYADEEKYNGGPVGPTDADIVWRYSMFDELGVFPHQMTSSSILVVGDRIYVTTSNGVDWTNKHIPNPTAPALICLDKKTGALLGQEKSGISSRTLACNWSSPTAGKVGDKELVIFGGGDGFCYAFDPVPVDGVLKEVWRCDANPPSRRLKPDGKPAKYGTENGPSEIISTPVLLNERVYVAIGQDPGRGNGKGALTCIDATKTGDITETGKMWTYDAINRSISTPSVVDGLIYLADFTGMVHCVDAATGAAYWTHETEGAAWGSTLVADGRVYVGNEPGAFNVLVTGKEKKVLATISFDGAVLSTPVVANGVMYVASDKYLYAIQDK